MEEIKEIKKNYEIGFIRHMNFFVNMQVSFLNLERRVNRLML